MKRILCTFSAALITLCLTMTAHANVFENAGNYLIKFGGIEYVYHGSHSNFISGNLGADQMLSEADLVGPGGKLTTGFNMSAIMYFTDIYTTDAAWSTPSQHNIYNESSPGLYFAVLRDLYASDTAGALGEAQDPKLFFTGGAVDWYYAPDGLLSQIRDLTYEVGKGLVNGVGEVFDLSAYTPFATFDFAGSNGHTGSANVSMEDGAIKGVATFNGNAPDGSLFDSDKIYGGYDILIQATLLWRGAHFEVHDPARVSVPTPEPASFALMGVGLVLAGLYARRRFR